MGPVLHISDDDSYGDDDDDDDSHGDDDDKFVDSFVNQARLSII